MRSPCALQVCCATPQHRNKRLDELVSLGILDVAQRLQKEEPNGDEIMSAYVHKMSTFSEDERDILICFFAHTFAGYYRYVQWYPNPMTIAPHGRDAHIGPSRPDGYPYMGRSHLFLASP